MQTTLAALPLVALMAAFTAAHAWCFLNNQGEG